MTLVKLSDLFDIQYGNKLDLNKQIIDQKGVAFINRTSKHLGLTSRIKPIGIPPYTAGLITVALGGSILESFVQLENFYTGQNVKVLTPKISLTFLQKIYYCMAIKKNAFKYSAFGREANITLEHILVPAIESIPQWVYDTPIPKKPSAYPLIQQQPILSIKNWKPFTLKNIFSIMHGKETIGSSAIGIYPLISSQNHTNGVSKYILNGKYLFNSAQLSIAHNGSVGSCFYQKEDFYATADITVLSSSHLNIYNALFIATLLEKEKYRFNYGRKWTGHRMANHLIKLPATPQGTPDWQFMEDYIQSLPYSSNLAR